jgi:hypothetical protein
MAISPGKESDLTGIISTHVRGARCKAAFQDTLRNNKD